MSLNVRLPKFVYRFFSFPIAYAFVHVLAILNSVALKVLAKMK